jgi:nucleoid DNA-binding protein
MKNSEAYEAPEITERVERHLRAVAESSGLPPGEESFKRITDNWLEKRRMFAEQTRLLGMEVTGELGAEDPRGAIMLTYSGSLITLGRTGTEGRWFEYASIKLRNDVPGFVKAEGVSVRPPVKTDEPATFSDCPIERSSDILLIAVCPEGVPAAEEETRLREASVFLTNGFVKLNRTLTLPEDTIGHFTLKTMVDYLAKKHGMTQAFARAVLNDFLAMTEAGMLMGENVPLGGIGRLRLTRRPAQKARLGRNPSTGEEITIPAKPETLVPKMAFSRRMKERAAGAPLLEPAE